MISNLEPILDLSQLTATPEGSINNGTKDPFNDRAAPIKLSVSVGNPWALHRSCSLSDTRSSTICFFHSSFFEDSYEKIFFF